MNRGVKDYSFETMDITQLDEEELTEPLNVESVDSVGIKDQDAEWAALTY